MTLHWSLMRHRAVNYFWMKFGPLRKPWLSDIGPLQFVTGLPGAPAVG